MAHSLRVGKKAQGFCAVFIIVVGLAFITPIRAHAETNLINNPTFAVGVSGTPTGWNKSAWGNASSAVFTYPVTGQDDNFAAKVSIANYGTAAGGGAAEWYFNNVPVTGGNLYDFSD